MSENSVKILYIEDNAEAASLLHEELTERGYELILAKNGQEGFGSILKHQPHLVLCDITMPVMSGFDVLEKLIHISPRFENMPFIFLTALGDKENEIKGRKLGADDYIKKPVDYDILDMIIKARLERVSRTKIWPGKGNLSEREIESLTWAARGKTSSEIAQILGLSKRTVDFHIDNARDKLGVKTRIQAAIKAATGHLIHPWDE